MRLTVAQLINKLKEYDMDAQVWVASPECASYGNIDVSADTEPDMGNDVYIVGYNN